jgi:ParB family chromosome partitioning protein
MPKLNLSTFQQKASSPTVGIQGDDARITLDEIVPRISSTREINPKHVEALAESIAVLGLIEPLALDIKNRLIAGGHREQALLLLRENDRTSFDTQFPDGTIPVHILPFDAEEDPDLALQCEIAENEKRRNYSKEEVEGLADRLIKAGYIKTKGRPRSGEKSLMPALSAVIGVSTRQLQRILKPKPQESATNVVLSQVRSSERAMGKAVNVARKQRMKQYEQIKSVHKEIQDLFMNLAKDL